MPINLRSEFIRATVVLTSGTALAQVIGYAFVPIITRLFTPEEIGEFGLYARIIAFISALATARYDFALPLPKRDDHAFQLFQLAIRLTLLTTVLTALGAFVYWVSEGGSAYALIFGASLVVGTFFASFRNIGTNWAIRNKYFRSISISKVSAALSTSVLSLLAGFMGTGGLGLVAAAALGHCFGALGFMRQFWRSRIWPGYQASSPRMRVLAIEHSSFPRYNMPHVLMDTGRDILLAYLVVHFFDTYIFGSYDHSFRMLKLPLMLIGTGIGQVFFNQLSDLHRDKKALAPSMKRMVLSLSLLSIAPFGIIWLYGQPIFELVFGEEWSLSGEISMALAPWLMVNFIASPLSFLPIVIGRQGLFFWLGLVGTMLQVLGFWLLPKWVERGELDMLQVFEYVSYAMAIFLIWVIWFTYHLAKRSDAER